MALILTLAILAMVTLLLIAFVTSMRVENAASKSFNDLFKARELALGAVDQAVATIRQATPVRTASPVSTYVTSPGLIYTNSAGKIGFISLSSPIDSSYSVSISTTNLNDSFWITGSNNVEFFDNSASAIPVGWVYLSEDGSVTGTSGVLTKPLVGRFAYWVDDEASKININTAFQRTTPSPDPIGDSTNSEVDLNVLLANLNGAAAAIHTKQASPGYSSIEEVKIADATVNAASFNSDFNTNRFYLTTYSNDGNYPSYTDDLDALGRQRLVVSNLQNPGDIDGTGGGGVSNALVRLKDPGLQQVYSSGGAFDAKYPVVGTTDGLKQIIANIFAYQIDPGTVAPPDGGGTPPVYLGLAKVPYINEVHVHYDFGGTSPNFTATRTVSVELIYQYDTPFSGKAGDNVVVTGLDTLGGLLQNTATIAANGVTFSGSGTLSGTPSYQIVSFTDPVVSVGGGPTKLPGPTLTVTYTRNYAGNPGARLNVAQMIIGTDNSPALPGVSDAGAEVNDPAVNASSSQWTAYKGTSPSVPPANNTVYAPTPDTTKVVIRGAPMKSIGELGYIHRPEPWKHLTLQPGGGTITSGQIPDWAILDAFTVSGSTPGRVNINSFIAGFTSAQRLVPLKALLNNVALGAAQNIYEGTYVTPPDAYGNTNAYDAIGEICEVRGLDNGATTDAGKEETIRRIANLITVRSNTFTIWVMAQSIKQPPGSVFGTFDPTKDLITGEVRLQAVVERYETAPGGTGSAPRFRIRYLRYL